MREYREAVEEEDVGVIAVVNNNLCAKSFKSPSDIRVVFVVRIIGDDELFFIEEEDDEDDG